MQDGHVVIDEQTIPFTIKKRKGQKYIRLIACGDGTFVVSAPRMCPMYSIDQTITQNTQWIKQHVLTQSKKVTIDPSVVKHIKKALRPIIETHLLQFNSYYGFSYNRVSIRYQRTRWGSCSSNGTLSFNCALMCISRELREYVVVHELCHLQEMNHSKKFWELVEKTIPQYKELRKQLKRSKL